MTEAQQRLAINVSGALAILVLSSLWNQIQDAEQRSARNEEAIARLETAMASNSANDERIQQTVMGWMMKEEQLRHHRDTLHCMALNIALPIDRQLDCGAGAGIGEGLNLAR